MTSPHDKVKWWRPRFTVGTLVIVVTLVCCYAACWGPTKRQGLFDLTDYLLDQHRVPDTSDMIAPLVLSAEEQDILEEVEVGDVVYFKQLGEPRRCYYFWFFGYVAKLPYEREVTVRAGENP